MLVEDLVQQGLACYCGFADTVEMQTANVKPISCPQALLADSCCIWINKVNHWGLTWCGAGVDLAENSLFLYAVWL